MSVYNQKNEFIENVEIYNLINRELLNLFFSNKNNKKINKFKRKKIFYLANELTNLFKNQKIYEIINNYNINSIIKNKNSNENNSNENFNFDLFKNIFGESYVNNLIKIKNLIY